MSENELFDHKVVPVMDSVMAEILRHQKEEQKAHMNSRQFLMASAVGPDGGMTAQAASLESLRYTGEWSSRHTEDFITMVSEELKRQEIEVTPELEHLMIDKMIRDDIPRSSIDYIMRKAATSSIFYLPYALSRSPLENNIAEEAERRYVPSIAEKSAGYLIGAASDALVMGGGWSAAARFAGADLALNTIVDAVDRHKDENVPDVVSSKETEVVQEEQPSLTIPDIQEEQTQSTVPLEKKEEPQKAEEHPSVSSADRTNSNGWNGVLGALGLDGITDITHNLGYVLAMIPDLLVAMLTGRSDFTLKGNLMPVASIMAGLFVRNPLLKMLLVGMGGANLLNKAGHEILGKEANQQRRVIYRQYEEEPLDCRIKDAELKGSCLVATIDGIPCMVSLPHSVIGAYNEGMLPLSTLCNAVLRRSDEKKMTAQNNHQQATSERYASENEETSRTLTQR